MENHLTLQRERDTQIIEAVQAYPMLDVALTQALVPMPYRIAARRLHSLSEHGVIYRYPDGLNHAVGYSAVRFGKADKPQVAHRLMASRFWVTADLAGIEVASRFYDHEIRPKINEAKLPLSPDGFGIFNDEPFFLEFYRSGTSLTRPTSAGRSILEKCRLYLRHNDRLKDLFHVNKFRVLILVESESRKDRVWRMLRENSIESGAFLIASEASYSPSKPASLSQPICASLKADELQSFVDIAG